MSMLSACAGTHAQRLEAKNQSRGSENAASTTYADAVEVTEVADADRLLLERNAAAAARRAPRSAHAREPHRQQEPSPGAQYAAEVDLLITAQIFVCSFVVVILDGHCEFYASTGYHYY